MACTAFTVNGLAFDIARSQVAVELPEVPSVYTAPVVTKV